MNACGYYQKLQRLMAGKYFQTTECLITGCIALSFNSLRMKIIQILSKVVIYCLSITPSLSPKLILAPLSTRGFITLKRPFSAAQCRGAI